ncbi:unnamed protein product [Vicia faba]|uniref:Uncharacterized protein n=1 Tax=Vicia faba TaxID=3906 RepID=A0AAV1AKE1_VICFA|nr:unnamed protein product [Vicia faba]
MELHLVYSNHSLFFSNQSSAPTILAKPSSSSFFSAVELVETVRFLESVDALDGIVREVGVEGLVEDVEQVIEEDGLMVIATMMGLVGFIDFFSGCLIEISGRFGVTLYCWLCCNTFSEDCCNSKPTQNVADNIVLCGVEHCQNPSVWQVEVEVVLEPESIPYNNNSIISKDKFSFELIDAECDEGRRMKTFQQWTTGLFLGLVLDIFGQHVQAVCCSRMAGLVLPDFMEKMMK